MRLLYRAKQQQHQQQHEHRAHGHRFETKNPNPAKEDTEGGREDEEDGEDENWLTTLLLYTKFTLYRSRTLTVYSTSQIFELDGP